jgi:protoheme ferro-lyase
MADMARDFIERVTARAESLKNLDEKTTLSAKHVNAALVQMFQTEPEYAAIITDAIDKKLKEYQQLVADDKDDVDTTPKPKKVKSAA